MISLLIFFTLCTTISAVKNVVLVTAISFVSSLAIASAQTEAEGKRARMKKKGKSSFTGTSSAATFVQTERHSRMYFRADKYCLHSMIPYVRLTKGGRETCFWVEPNVIKIQLTQHFANIARDCGGFTPDLGWIVNKRKPKDKFRPCRTRYRLFKWEFNWLHWQKWAFNLWFSTTQIYLWDYLRLIFESIDSTNVKVSCYS